jgi:hypothetical protein
VRVPCSDVVSVRRALANEPVHMLYQIRNQRVMRILFALLQHMKFT